MWLEEPRRTPPRHWATPRPSASHHLEGCPAGHPACDAFHAETVASPAVDAAPQQRPCTLEEFASRSTLHGIQHIFRHERYSARNLLWLLAFLGSLALLVHVYAKCLGFYFQYPHSTQLEEETVRGMAFPAITLCNLNPARFSQLSSHDLYWAGELLGLLDGAGRILALDNVDGSILDALQRKMVLSEEERSRPFDFIEFYERVSHQLDLGEMLVSCRFGDEKCNGSDFQTVVCKIFQHGNNRKKPKAWMQVLIHCLQPCSLRGDPCRPPCPAPGQWGAVAW
ncbi:acid-sensing ion channel 1-like [Struthio camelus]|uniref:acid-sensing ion channel 1-like n=1 Tax=Struthio camelus TaxID=8801 RepID=UPI003603FEE4